MAQTDQCNVHDVVQSLSDSIQQKLVKPSETKFVTLLEKTREDLHTRSTTTEQQVYQRLDQLAGKVEQIEKTQKRMGILCLTLSAAVVASIIIQMI
ncbi:MAG: hypothetical protein FH756_07540 [Firmicutes bacterium]|nr:hypothetical protein [Bacillota bacterium]